MHTWHARWGGVQCGLLTFLTATPKCLRIPCNVQKRKVADREWRQTEYTHHARRRGSDSEISVSSIALNFCKATKAKRSGEYWRSSSYPWWWQSWGVSRWIRPPIIAKSGAACMLYLLGPFAGICMHGRHQCANYSIMTNSFDSHRPKQVLRFV